MSRSVQVGPNALLIGGTSGRTPYASRTLTTTATVLASDDLILLDSTAGGWTQAVPLSSGRGQMITFKKVSSDANVITISRSGSNLIDGITSYLLSAHNDFVTLGPVTGGYEIVAKGTMGSTGSTTYLTTDPRFYSAAADGTHDDSAAVSSAISAGGLFLQQGIVYAYTWAGISAAIAAVTAGFQINGGGTLRLLSGSTPALTFAASTVIKLYDFVVDGNGQTGTNSVIYLNAATNVYMRGLLVIGGGSNPNLGLNGAYTYEASGCHGIDDQIGLI